MTRKQIMAGFIGITIMVVIITQLIAILLEDLNHKIEENDLRTMEYVVELRLDNKQMLEEIIELHEKIDDLEQKSVQKGSQIDDLSRFVRPTQRSVPVKPEKNDYRIAFTEEELEHFGMLVQHEAGGESYECKLWVANVIINRVLDERFPDTLMGVIYDKKHAVQFTPIVHGLYKEPDEKTMAAIFDALSQDSTDGCWIFNNASLTSNDKQSWFDNFEMVAEFDKMQFRR